MLKSWFKKLFQLTKSHLRAQPQRSVRPQFDAMEDRVVPVSTIVDFDTAATGLITQGGTTFTSSSHPWTLSGNLIGELSSGSAIGSPASGSASPNSANFIDTDLVHRDPGSVGAIVGPSGFVFHALSIDIWPSSSQGSNIIPYQTGVNDVPGETGHNFEIRGYRNNALVVDVTVKDTLRTPPETGSSPGGYWHHLDFTTTSLSTTDVDKVEFVLLTQSGNATDGPSIGSPLATPDYIALDNFEYSSFAAAATNSSPTLSPLSFSSTSIAEGGVTTLTVNFTDPDVSDSHSTTINWGDTTSTVVASIANGATFTHTYKDNRTPATNPYTVSVSVADASVSDAKTATVSVSNVTPSITSFTAVPSVNEGSAATATLNFTDPGTLDTFTATIDWGDSTASTYVGVSSGQTFTHVYVDGPFTYGIKGKVTDKDGATSAEQTTPMNVNNVTPTITGLSGLTVAVEGQVFTTSVQFSDPAGSNDTYTASIFWGDSPVSVYNGVTSGQNFSHTYPDGDAVLSQSVVITDSDGASSTASVRNVTVYNSAPGFTTINAPTSINEGETAGVTVFFSDLGVNDTHTMTVNWGDTTIETVSDVSSGQVYTHLYPDGTVTRTIDFQVGDNGTTNNLSSHTRKTVTVNNVAPTIQSVILSDATIDEGGATTLTVNFNDPAGVNDTYTATVDWGDTTISTFTAFANGGKLSHIYSDGPLARPISVFVGDEDGGVSESVTVDVTVANIAPSLTSIAASPATVAEGANESLTLDFSDPAGTYDTYTAVVNWGDSSIASVYTSVTSGQILTHAYADGPNDYVISASVHDEDGGSTTVSNANVTVVNAAPSITSLVLAAATIAEGSNAALTVSFSDPGTGDTHVASITWGDNTTLQTLAVSNGQVVMHQYRDNYNPAAITVVVTDDDGASSSASIVNETITNVTPALSAITLQTPVVNAGSAASIVIRFTDPGTADTFTAVELFFRDRFYQGS